MNHRIGLFGIALILTLTVGPLSPAKAEWQPSQDVEFVIPYGLGGGADLLARTIIKIMQEEQLVPVNIAAVNKPGGGAAVGVSYVASAKNADPHTLVLFNPQTQITPMRVEGALGWRSLTPVAGLMLDDYLLFVRKDSPYQSATELVTDAKAREARAVSIGSAGTADDMAIAVFEAGTDIQLNTVRFNSGGEILTALLGGHVDLGAGNPLEFMGHLAGGEIRALGVYRPSRFETLPDVPTMQEQGINVVPFQMWRGVAMPQDAPQEAVDYWTDIMNKVGESPTFKDYISSNVATLNVLTGDAFMAFLEEQEQLYKDMLKRLGII